MKAHCAICAKPCTECKDSLDICKECNAKLHRSYCTDTLALHEAQNSDEALQALRDKEDK